MALRKSWHLIYQVRVHQIFHSELFEIMFFALGSFTHFNSMNRIIILRIGSHVDQMWQSIGESLS